MEEFPAVIAAQNSECLSVLFVRLFIFGKRESTGETVARQYPFLRLFPPPLSYAWERGKGRGQ